MSSISVLTCEDNNDLREALATALRAADFTVYEAGDGVAGVEQALTHHPDVILMDILMPGLNGHEAVKKIRLDPWGKTAKIIYLSALSDAENVVHAVKSGSEEYIVKTHTNLADIVEKIRLAKHT